MVTENYFGDENVEYKKGNLEEMIKHVKEKIQNIDDTSKKYEYELTVFTQNVFDEKIASEFLEKECKSKTKHFVDINVAYVFFYCLNIYHRINYNYDDLQKLWEDYSKYFVSFKSLRHLDVLRFLLEVSISKKENSLGEILRYLQKAYENASEFSDNSGYLHAFVDLYVSIYERGINEFDVIENKWKRFAFSVIDDAISCEPEFAKYHCTKGRLLSIYGEYEYANREILLAISLEDSKRGDYGIRLTEYQYYRNRNQYNEQNSNLKKQSKYVEETIRRSTMSNVEIVAFFSGVVSFLIGSLSLASGETAFCAAVLISVLACSLLGVFAAFTLMIHSNDESYNKKVPLICCFISILLLGILLAVLYFTGCDEYISVIENNIDFIL